MEVSWGSERAIMKGLPEEVTLELTVGRSQSCAQRGGVLQVEDTAGAEGPPEVGGGECAGVRWSMRPERVQGLCAQGWGQEVPRDFSDLWVAPCRSRRLLQGKAVLMRRDGSLAAENGTCAQWLCGRTSGRWQKEGQGPAGPGPHISPGWQRLMEQNPGQRSRAQFQSRSGIIISITIIHKKPLTVT